MSRGSRAVPSGARKNATCLPKAASAIAGRVLEQKACLSSTPRDAPSEAGMVDLDARPRESAIVNAVDDFDACDREIVTSIGPANAAHYIFGIIRLGSGREDDEA